ncbi:uncharacterized protein [Polyergus mexicanus]|uniref:uncharacterized protein n=1 Tax=Polyergus mexicanus TaxID=615972 RepID=UPI0038B58367
MARARREIDLPKLGIDSLRVREAATGAMIVELAGSGEKEGPTASQRADALYADLRRVFAGDEGVRLARPIRKAELRLRGLDRSIAAADIAAAVAGAGACEATDIRVGDIKFPTRGLGTVWVQCPLRAANKIAAARAIQIGWSRAQAELLDRRPLQCFKCLERGHVQQHCSSPIDRRGCCYRCGESGHLARDCAGRVRCPICAGLGRPADHRVGSARCTPPRGRPGKQREPPPSASAAGVNRSVNLAEITAAPDTRKRGTEDRGSPSETPKEKRPPKARPTAVTPPTSMAEVVMAEPRDT